MNEDEKNFFTGEKNCSLQTIDSSGNMEKMKVNEKKNLIKVTMLAVIFVSLFSSSNAFEYMVSQIYFQLGYSSLGNITLITTFFSMGVLCIFAPFVAKFFSFKISMFICSFSFILSQLVGAFTCYCDTKKDWVLCDEIFIYFTNIFSSLLMGFFSVILWNCQCGYTTNICDDKHKSLYFGIFTCIFQISIFSGSIITAFIMKLFENHLLFFIVCLCLTIASSFSFLCLPDVETLNYLDNGSLQEKLKELYGIFKRKDKISVSAIAGLIGLEIGFWIGNFYRIIELTLSKNLTEEQVNVYTAWIFSCVGLFEILGGLLASFVGDKIKKYHLIYLSNFLLFLGFSGCLLIYYINNYYLCFIVGGFIGMGDCIAQIMINALVSLQGDSIAHFSHYIIIQNSVIGISILLGLTLNSFIYLIVVICLQIVLFFITIYFEP